MSSDIERLNSAALAAARLRELAAWIEALPALWAMAVKLGRCEGHSFDLHLVVHAEMRAEGGTSGVPGWCIQ